MNVSTYVEHLPYADDIDHNELAAGGIGPDIVGCMMVAVML